MIIPHRRSKNNKAYLAEQFPEEHSLKILTKEGHNLTGISRSKKGAKSVISAGVWEHDSEEDPHCNMTTTEIEIECSELRQPSCLGSVKKASKDDADESESYPLNVSNFG